jgi:hypothetical protein
MHALTDADLYRPGVETLLASWEEYARGARGASVERLAGVAAGCFRTGPSVMSTTTRSSSAV